MPHGASREGGCKYDGVPEEGVWLVERYYVWVEEGSAPLTDLPYWMAEIAELVRIYRADKEAREEADRRAKERCRDLMEQYGYGRGP